MIVYGRKSRLLKAEFVHEKCPNCKTPFSVQMNVYQKYAHIFWIPFFPIGKTGISVCSNCRQVLKLNDMPELLRTDYDNLESTTKTPLWAFSGLGLIAVIAIAITINTNNDNKQRNQYVLSPKKGDIIEVKTDTVYGLYKLMDISKDSVLFVTSKYETNDESDVTNITSKGFDTITYVMPRSKLVELNNSDKIIQIDRN